MAITNFRIKSSDVMFHQLSEEAFFETGLHLKHDNKTYCAFGIDFDKVISYNVKKVTFDHEPAIAVFVNLTGGKEYFLIRKISDSCLTKVFEEICSSQYMLKSIFKILTYDFSVMFGLIK